MGASEVFKNQSFKSQLFSSLSEKKYLKLKILLNFNAITFNFFLIRLEIHFQLSENLQMGFKSFCLVNK